MAEFWLTLSNDTVQLLGGYDRTEDLVLVTWTAPRGLQWINYLAVGVQFNADQATHTFYVYRGEGWLHAFQTPEVVPYGLSTLVSETG